MDYQLNSNYHEVTRLDDYDYTSNILITDEELDRELEEVDKVYRIFEENESVSTTLRNRHKNLKNINIKNTGDIVKIHRNTKTIYLTRFAFISLLLAANMFAYYFSINQHKFIKLIKN